VTKEEKGGLNMRKLFVYVVLISLFVLSLAACGGSGGGSGESLFYAGAAKVDVTPPLEYSYPQGGKGGMSTGLHHNPAYIGYPSDPDRLYARALALSWKGTDLILVALDSMGMSLDDVQFVRTAVSAKLGIAVANVIVSSSHTHNAPDIVGVYGGFSPSLCLPPPDGLGYCATHYREQVILPGIISAVEKAYRSREWATLKVGQVDAPDLVFNRRTWTSANRNSGIIDPELTVLQFATTAGNEVIATLANFSVHMVPAVGSHLMSADAPGYLVAKLEKKYGGVGLFVPGAIGNHNPSPYFNAADPYPFDAAQYPFDPNDPNLNFAPMGTIWDDKRGNPYQDPNNAAWDILDPQRRILRSCWDATEAYAQKLSDKAIQALNNGNSFNQPNLKVEKSIVSIPLENPGFVMLLLPMDNPVKVMAGRGTWGAQLAQLASSQGKRTMYTKACGTNPAPFPFDGKCYWIDTEVFVAKIGPVAFATVPGELFVETQLILKSKLPGNGFVVGLAPEELGYIAPTHYIDAYWNTGLINRYGPIPALDYWGSKGPSDYESHGNAVTVTTGIMTQNLLEAIFPMIDKVK